MTRKSLLLLALTALTALGLLAACSGRSGSERPLVTVSIEPLRYVVEQLADSLFDVATITPEGASPETYQPTPRQVEALSQSVAYVRVGTLGFERTQLERMTKNVPHLLQVNASRGIPPLVAPSSEDEEGGNDPHAWTSPREMRLVAYNVAQALVGIDTTQARTISERLWTFNARMDSIESAVRSRLRQAPCRTFLINHPALGYYARNFGLRQLSVEQDGKDASPRRVEELIGECRREGVRVAFVLKGHNGATARRIAEAVGADVVEVDPLAYDWEGELWRVTCALAP